VKRMNPSVPSTLTRSTICSASVRPGRGPHRKICRGMGRGVVEMALDRPRPLTYHWLRRCGLEEISMNGSTVRPSAESRRGWAFVSYAHEDEKRVGSIVDYLESHNIEVWWDDLLRPGDAWRWALKEKLGDAACVVIMWSKASVQSVFVAAEASEALHGARGSGRLVPVLLDKHAAADIPLPFKEFQYHDLSMWDGRARRPLAPLASVVRNLVKRPPRSEERWGPNLGDGFSVGSAKAASTQMRQLSQRVGSLGEVLLGDDRAVEDVRAALGEVHKTLDVVAGAVEEFVTAGLTQNGLDPRSYVRFERGALSRQIRDGRGHCDLIALHYGRRDGVRAWLKAHATKQVLTRADKVFTRLSQADGDLFQSLGQIGDALTNESRIVVNLLTAGQVEAARQRVLAGRKRLAPLEADLQKSIEVLQAVEHSLGFAPRV
jgi:hypothetical protein